MITKKPNISEATRTAEDGSLTLESSLTEKEKRDQRRFLLKSRNKKRESKT